MADYIGDGTIITSGEARTYSADYVLLDFTPLSKNRKYNVGLDENNKYPEDYRENYHDVLKK